MRKYIMFLFVGIMTVCLFGCQAKEEIVDGNLTKPAIFVDEKLYWLSGDIKNTREISDDFKFYGKVTSAVEKEIDVPKIDLQTTKIMDNEIGYSVYLSREKDIVTIFNEKIREFVYYE